MWWSRAGRLLLMRSEARRGHELRDASPMGVPSVYRATAPELRAFCRAILCPFMPSITHVRPFEQI